MNLNHLQIKALHESLIEAIGEVWSKGVHEDYLKGYFWNKEQCVHSSLYHHLRLKLSSNYRIWQELRVSGKSGISDLVVAVVNETEFDDRQHKYDKFSSIDIDYYQILAVIEVKYATRNFPNWDIKKLRAVGKIEPRPTPILAFVEGTSSSHLNNLIDSCKKHGIMLMYGASKKNGVWDIY